MIDTVTIGFSRPKNKLLPVGSWAIRAFMKTPYSHVYIRFYSESINRTLIYEAVGTGGVRFVGFNLWSSQAEELKSYTLQVKKCNSTTLLQELVDDCGMKYGYLQNFGIFLASVLGWNKNPWRKGRNCSEIVAKFLKSEGYEVKKSLDLITPKDIELIICSKSST